MTDQTGKNSLVPVTLSGRISSFFRRQALTATGVDAAGLFAAEGSAQEVNKFITFGSLVLLTCTFALLGAWFFFYQILQNLAAGGLGVALGVVLGLPFAICWSLVIYNFDRGFLNTMFGIGARGRWAAGTIRLFAAILIGLIISHPMKMLAFSGPISGYQSFLERVLLSSTTNDRQEEIDGFENAVAAAEQKVNSLVGLAQLGSAFETILEQNGTSTQEILSQESREEVNRRRYNAQPLTFIANDFSQVIIAGVYVKNAGGGCSLDLDDTKFYTSMEQTYIESFGRALPSVAFLTELSDRYDTYEASGKDTPKSPESDRHYITTCGLARISILNTDALRVTSLPSPPSEARIEDAMQTANSLRGDLNFALRTSARDAAHALLGDDYLTRASVYSLISASDDSGFPEDLRLHSDYDLMPFSKRGYREFLKYAGYAITIVFVIVEIAAIAMKLISGIGPFEASVITKGRNQQAAADKAHEKRSKAEENAARRSENIAIGFKSVLLDRLAKSLEGGTDAASRKRLIEEANEEWRKFEELLRDMNSPSQNPE